MRSMQHWCGVQDGECTWALKCICNCASCEHDVPLPLLDTGAVEKQMAADAAMQSVKDDETTITFLIPVACREGHDPLPDELPVAKQGVPQLIIKFCRNCKGVYWVHA